MSSIEFLQRQIHTAQNLRAVVKMMKVLAAVNIHQYEQAVACLAEYNRTIEMGLHVVLKAAQTHEIHNQPKNADRREFGGRCGAVIFGSEQGMCGQFNEQIGSYAIAELERSHISPEQLVIFAVGSRIMPHLETAGYEIDRAFTMPSSLAGIVAMVQEILLHIATWRDRQQVVRILFFFNHLHANTTTFFEPCQLQLWPLDRAWLQHIESQEWQSRTIPTFTMPSDALVASLLQQYFFISLYRAFGESLASENASRLASMQVAEKNIEDRLAEFTSQFQQERQTAITEELLEVISGFELSN